MGPKICFSLMSFSKGEEIPLHYLNIEGAVVDLANMWDTGSTFSFNGPCANVIGRRNYSFPRVYCETTLSINVKLVNDFKIYKERVKQINNYNFFFRI